MAGSIKEKTRERKREGGCEDKRDRWRERYGRVGEKAWSELLVVKNAEISVRKEVEDDEDKWVVFPHVIPPF